MKFFEIPNYVCPKCLQFFGVKIITSPSTAPLNYIDIELYHQNGKDVPEMCYFDSLHNKPIRHRIRVTER